MKIKLFCASGMSTSMLVNKMREATKKRNLDCTITAYSINDFSKEIEDVDVILLAPQVAYQLDDLKEKAKEINKPINLIPMIDYGMLNGENVLKMSLKLGGLNE